MNRTLIISIAAATLFLTACATKKTATVKSSDIHGSGVIQYPVIADLDVKEQKVSGSVQWRGGGASLNDLKEMAMTDAVKKSNADVLIEPTFEIEIKGRRKSVTAVGYPANYKNFRNATPADTVIQKIVAVKKLETHEPLVEARKAKRTLAGMGAGLGGVGLIILLILLL